MVDRCGPGGHPPLGTITPQTSLPVSRPHERAGPHVGLQPFVLRCVRSEDAHAFGVTVVLHLEKTLLLISVQTPQWAQTATFEHLEQHLDAAFLHFWLIMRLISAASQVMQEKYLGIVY